ncbi:MAG: c-type cytochrome [Planctomycetes bacterium]|nr:c-type cytochrome [Planctomycetota bacterium]
MTSADMTNSDKLRAHEFDGIREFDNHLPKWWLWTLYLAVLFSVGYWVHYEVLRSGLSSGEHFALAVQADDERIAKKLGPISNETLLELTKLESRVAAGKAEFVKTCAQCHTANGGGGIGPNLTDKYWLHGNTPMEIKKTIDDGVVEKGMAAWKDVLGPKLVTDLVAYILTIKNTNVPGGKEPQGEPYDN